MASFAPAIMRLAVPTLIAVGLLVGNGVGLVAEAAPGFVPHRAVYDLSLGKSRGNGSVTRAQGKLEFEWADACTGWTVNQRTRVQMNTTEGRVIDFGWTLNSLESQDGREYRFFIRRFNADGTTESIRGKAHSNETTGVGVGQFDEPTKRDVALPRGTMFPTRHSLLLIEAAQSGELPLWRNVFDGSGDDGLFGINAVLSGTLAPDAPKSFESLLLQQQQSWRLNLAYFSMDETAAEPEHEQSLRLYANGVVDEMLLDYGDFVLKADLLELEALPEVICQAE